MHTHQLRFLIPSSLAGAIIGKKGKNIEKLRNEIDGTISVPNSQSPERVLAVKANSFEESLRVYFRIMDLIELDAMNKANQQYNPTLGEHNVRLLLQHNLVGGLIGPGGAHITKLRERTQAKIKIYGECCPRSSERVVEISGKSRNVKFAVENIILSCNSGAVTHRESNNLYDPNDHHPVSASAYGGYSRADGDESVSGRSSICRSNSSVSVNSTKRRYDPCEVSSKGKHQSAEPLFVTKRRMEHLVLLESCQVSVPSALLPLIIGPSGSRLQQTQKESNCEIMIHGVQPGNNECTILIVGSTPEIEHALDLLRQSVGGCHQPLMMF